MKIAAKYLLLVLAAAFTGHLAVAAGNWPDGLFSIVPAFASTLGIFVVYLAVKLFRSEKLSVSESEKRESPVPLILKILFSLTTLYLLLRYTGMAILANGMMSFGSHSPMTAGEFFRMIIPGLITISYGISAWRPNRIAVWMLRILAIYIVGNFLARSFGRPSAGDAAVFMILYLSTWAFLTTPIAKKKIQPVAGVNSVTSLRDSTP